MANQFSVTPLGGQSPLQGLGMLAQGLEQKKAEEAAEAEKVRRGELMTQAQRVMATGDPNAIAEFSLANPEIGQQLQSAVGYKSDATRQNMRDSMREIIAGGDPEEVISKRINMVTAQGGDPSDSVRELEVYRADPEGYTSKVEAAYAFEDPEGYKSYRTTLPEAADGLKPTTKMQDFAKYQSLKETDPQSALQFGVAAGFVDKATGIEETPASVRETEWFLKQTPEVQAQHIKLKRKTDPTMAEKLELEQSKSDIKVDEEGKKQTVKGIATRQQGYIDSGVEAADAIGNAYKVSELLDTVETGGFENAALAAKRLFGIESADEAQLSAGLGKAILSQLKPIFGAAFTAQEGERLEKIEANFGKSTAGNKRLIDDVIKITERAANRGIRAAEAQGDKFAADEIRSALDAIKKVDKESPPNQEVTEGTVIQNPTTGEQLILQGGQWVTYNG